MKPRLLALATTCVFGIFGPSLAHATTLSEFDSKSSQVQGNIVADALYNITGNLLDDPKEKDTVECISRLYKTKISGGSNRLMLKIIDGLDVARNKNDHDYKVNEVVAAVILNECSDENAGQRDQLIAKLDAIRFAHELDLKRKAAEDVLKELKAEERQLKAKLEELDRNAWRLPDGTLVYAHEKEGKRIWVYQDGREVPRELYSKIAPPKHEKQAKDKDVTGEFRVDGTNPDGSQYVGTLRISKETNGWYNFRWTIGRDKYFGTGRLVDGVISVDFGGRYPAIYRVVSNDALEGTWDNGRASERLTRSQ